jgi:hypothetical protein
LKEWVSHSFVLGVFTPLEKTPALRAGKKYIYKEV